MNTSLEPQSNWKKLYGCNGLAEIEKAVAHLLDAKNAPKGRELNIHDPVWGTSTYKAHEIELINTPLFQRLHRIKQLGGCFAVFPAATHTRFEHTLGVATLAGRYADALKSSSEKNIDETTHDNIRFAALCHDLGHGPLSHCSEKVLGELAPIPQLLKISQHKSKPAEALSWLIVTSKPMRNFVKRINDRHDTRLNCDLIAQMIVGRLPPDQHYLNEILSGPIDADKTDYLQRDGKYSGIPVELDWQRMLNCITVEAYPSSSAASRRLVCDKNGLMPFLQLIQHRNHMITVVYQHVTVRSYAAMLNSALDLAKTDGTELGGRQLQTAADILLLDDESVFAVGKQNSASARLLSDIHNRRLYKIAASISEDKNITSDFHDQIVKCVGAEPEQILFDKSSLPSFSEAENLLIKTADGLLSINKIVDTKKFAPMLLKDLKSSLVLCPEHLREKVKKAVDELLN